MKNTEQAKLTADTITDEQIRELRDRALGSGEPFRLPGEAYDVIRATNKALGGGRESTRREGRARCAEILNARAEGK
jgi:hypothetical protein